MRYTYEVLDEIVPENIEVGDMFPWEEDDGDYDTSTQEYSVHNANMCIGNAIRAAADVEVDVPIENVETGAVLYPFDSTGETGVRVMFGEEGVVEGITAERDGETIGEYDDIASATKAITEIEASVGIAPGTGAVDVVTYVGTRKERKDDWGKDMLKGNGHKVKAANEDVSFLEQSAYDIALENMSAQESAAARELAKKYREVNGRGTRIPQKIRNNPEAMTALSTGFQSLDSTGKDVMVQALHDIRQIGDFNPLMLNLLGEMIREVPLRSVADVRTAGFDTRAAKRGSADDAFAIQAISGWMQSGQNPNELKRENGEPLPRKDIEQKIADWRQGRKNLKQTKKNEREQSAKKLTQEQENVQDALRAMAFSENEIRQFLQTRYRDYVRDGYSEEESLQENIRVALNGVHV